MKGQPQGSGQVAPGQAAGPLWACPGVCTWGSLDAVLSRTGLALKLGAHENRLSGGSQAGGSNAVKMKPSLGSHVRKTQHKELIRDLGMLISGAPESKSPKTPSARGGDFADDDGTRRRKGLGITSSSLPGAPAPPPPPLGSTCSEARGPPCVSLKEQRTGADHTCARNLHTQEVQ